jgi:hypothetical protein
MLVILLKSCKAKCVVHYYLGSFNTNYIIFRNVEDFKIKKRNKKLVEENIESSRIFYLSKLKLFKMNLLFDNKVSNQPRYFGI